MYSDNKTFVKDLQSQKYKWEDLKIPEELIDNLVKPPLMYQKPSIIQSAAIPKIMAGGNILFQSANGSGKTGAFAIPAIMGVDRTIDNYQVLIMANTRELIRQIS